MKKTCSINEQIKPIMLHSGNDDALIIVFDDPIPDAIYSKLRSLLSDALGEEVIILESSVNAIIQARREGEGEHANYTPIYTRPARAKTPDMSSFITAGMLIITLTLLLIAIVIAISATK